MTLRAALAIESRCLSLRSLRTGLFSWRCRAAGGESEEDFGCGDDFERRTAVSLELDGRTDGMDLS